MFVGTAVGNLPEERRGLPVLVNTFLDNLNPVVGDVHSHAIVEAVATIGYRSCEAGHTADLLGNSDSLRIDFVDEGIGQREVTDGIAILPSIIVSAIVGVSGAETVIKIDHAGDAVEAEAIEAELVHPVLAVGEKEVDDVVGAVVEAKAVPLAVFATLATIKILTGVAGKKSESLVFVLHGMAMDKVHDDADALTVSFVDELLELLGGTEAAGGGKETADMVAE